MRARWTRWGSRQEQRVVVRGEGSHCIWIDEADDEGAETVGVEGTDGCKWRQSTYAVEMSREEREGWISGRIGYNLTLYGEYAQKNH